MAAIYMWPVDDQILLTTTLYPVEVVDSLQVGLTFSGGFLDLIPGSDFQSTQLMQDGTYIQVRWFYEDGPYDSDLASTQGMEDGTYIQVRWFYEDGPYDSDLQSTQTLLDGTYVSKLIEADTPDEELQLALTINDTCSMDAI